MDTVYRRRSNVVVIVITMTVPMRDTAIVLVLAAILVVTFRAIDRSRSRAADPAARA